MAENGPAQMINETCESTSASDAKLAVWEYGLYTTSDDLRYDMKNPGFELKSEEEFKVHMTKIGLSLFMHGLIIGELT